MPPTTREEDLQAALWGAVQRICGETGAGGRVLLQGKGRPSPNNDDDDEDEDELAVVRVFDCPLWTAQATARLRAAHPAALVSVEPSATSLSGFVVAVSERAPRASHRRRLRLRVLAAMLFLCAVAALGWLEASSSSTTTCPVVNASK